MRIVSGDLKGRRFHPPDSFKARPTTDFAKENLFNVLNNLVDFEEIRVLDLFSGTGSISYEFASRGCRNITSVELRFQHREFIVRTIRDLKLEGAIHSIRADAFHFVRETRNKYDLVFADPPFDLEKLDTLPDLIFEHDILTDDGLFVLEHGTEGRFNEHPNFDQTRNYGKVNFTFFKKKRQDTAENE